MSNWQYSRITTTQEESNAKNFGVLTSVSQVAALTPVTGDYFLCNFTGGRHYSVDSFCEDWDFVDHADADEEWDNIPVSGIDDDIPNGAEVYAHVWNDTETRIEAWFKLENIGEDIQEGDTVFSCKVVERYSSAPFAPYIIGTPYIWDGSDWTEMNLTSAANAEKALNCLGGALSAGIQLPQSSDGLWKWVGNLVAQNAAIQNLFAQTIKLLNGGSIESDNYVDGSRGFKIQHNGDAVFSNARIVGDSTFSGKFNCGVIRTEVRDDTKTAYQTTRNDYDQARDFYSVLSGCNANTFYRCELDGITSAIRYVKKSYTSATTNKYYDISFYDSEYSLVDITTVVSCNYTGTKTPYLRTNQTSRTSDRQATWTTSALVVNIFTGNNVLVVSNLPDSATETGVLYKNPTTGALYVTL